MSDPEFIAPTQGWIAQIEAELERCDREMMAAVAGPMPTDAGGRSLLAYRLFAEERDARFASDAKALAEAIKAQILVPLLAYWWRPLRGKTNCRKRTALRRARRLKAREGTTGRKGGG